MGNFKFFLVGIIFGIILIKSEVVSWFRIQEMFRFQDFHMYGIIGLAILVGAISIQLIKRFNIKTIEGHYVSIPPKPMHIGVLIGGIIFGLGWALTGACPGPIFGLIGSGYYVYILVFISAVAGTWSYGLLKNKLPH